MFTKTAAIDAFTISSPAKLSVTLFISSQGDSPPVVHGNFSELSLPPLKLISSEVGAVDVAAASDILAKLLPSVLVPQLNKIISAEFPIPATKGVRLEHAMLEVEPGSLILSADLGANASL